MFYSFYIFGYNPRTHVKPPPPTANVYSGWEVWINVPYFLTAWWMLYWAVFLISKQGSEWSCRILTLIHGSLVTYFAVKDIIVNKQKLDYQNNIPLSDYQKYYLSITFSYFLFDLGWIHIFGSETMVIYIHHITSICFLFKSIWSNVGGPIISWGLAGLEFTNPYLQTRWFLRTHGYNGTLTHTVIELWFISTFFLIRIIGGTILIYLVEFHPGWDLVTKIICILIYVVSWLLYGQIFMFVKKKYWARRRELGLTSSGMTIFPYAVHRLRRTTMFHSQYTGREPEQPGNVAEQPGTIEPTRTEQTGTTEQRTGEP